MDDKSKPVGGHAGVHAPAGLVSAGYSQAVVHIAEDKDSKAINSQMTRNA